MELINIKSSLLGDDLKKKLKLNSKLTIVDSYFLTYAFVTLKNELSNNEELEELMKGE